MREVAYTCDRCGYETDSWDNTRSEGGSSRQMWTVGVAVRHSQHLQSVGAYVTEGQRADWCDSCVREMGLVGVKPTPNQDPPPPTLEDIIREIVREETTS